MICSELNDKVKGRFQIKFQEEWKGQPEEWQDGGCVSATE